MVIASTLMEPLVEFGGKVKRAAGEVKRIGGALTGTESGWMLWSRVMSASLCGGKRGWK